MEYKPEDIIQGEKVFRYCSICKKRKALSEFSRDLTCKICSDNQDAAQERQLNRIKENTFPVPKSQFLAMKNVIQPTEGLFQPEPFKFIPVDKAPLHLIKKAIQIPMTITYYKDEEPISKEEIDLLYPQSELNEVECSIPNCGIPNSETIAALKEDMSNRPRFNSTEALMASLNSDSEPEFKEVSLKGLSPLERLSQLKGRYKGDLRRLEELKSEIDALKQNILDELNKD